MDTDSNLLVFTLEDQRFALRLPAVDRVIHVVETVRVPDTPACVLGVVTVYGRVLPVIDLRKRFGLPDRDIRLYDHLIVAHTARWTLALRVDTVTGVIERPDAVASSAIYTGLECIEGVIRLDDGLVLIHDLDRVLSHQDEIRLNAALQARKTKKGGKK